MKQIKFFAAVVVAALALSSCSSYSFTSRSTKIEQSNITAVGMLVDVRPDFSKRIIAESGKCKTPMQAKEEAKYIAVTSNNCDVIVDPIYKVEKRGRNYRAYLTGFAGYFKNPRTLYEDVNLLKGVSREDIEKLTEGDEYRFAGRFKAVVLDRSEYFPHSTVIGDIQVGKDGETMHLATSIIDIDSIWCVKKN